jgi:hypothetical protein
MVNADLELRYSGGAGNTSPGAALGGAMSTAGGGVVDDNIKNDLFDDVSAGEAAAGDIEYRGIYCAVKTGATGSLDAPKAFISQDSANGSDIIDIALADEAINVAMETIADESTAPVGPSFSHPTTYAGGLALNGGSAMVANDERGLWVRRSITAAAPSGSITNALKMEGTTV